ncbi:protein translocase SEC61 complex subunit gamma [Candidatus Micrarchaeota archaeon]|nr:protein translocase SEC61 complex subunit gamma [Candidatus Micrarchaeota archaeon]
MNIHGTFIEPLVSFAEQSKRVLNITHKPQDAEFRQMTLTTGIGLSLIGIIGFIISMAAHFARLI